MIDLGEKYLKEVIRIIKLNVPQCEVRAFGSRINGPAQKYSDLDLVIIGKEKIKDTVLSALKEDLAESDLPITIDILDWNAISDSFKEVISNGYEVIYKA